MKTEKRLLVYKGTMCQGNGEKRKGRKSAKTAKLIQQSIIYIIIKIFLWERGGRTCKRTVTYYTVNAEKDHTVYSEYHFFLPFPPRSFPPPHHTNSMPFLSLFRKWTKRQSNEQNKKIRIKTHTINYLLHTHTHTTQVHTRKL